MRKVYPLLLCCLGITKLSAQVNLTATGGTTSATYTTLGAAFAGINAGTHTGVVTLDISSSTTETGPCVLNSSGAGSASYTSVTIRPSADGVSISGATATGRGLIELNGADNVTIDGDNPGTTGTNRNLTITNTAANTITYTSCVRLALSTLITSADNNTIKNCNLIGSGTGRNISTVTSETITWGVIVSAGASTAAATTAPSALTSGTTTTGTAATATNLLIDNNNIQTVARGVSVNGNATSVATGLVISNNIIGNATAGAVDQVWGIGITAQGSTNGVISGNTVRVESYVESSTPNKGIDIGTVSATAPGTFTIERNVVERVINNAPGTYNAFGINLQGAGTNTVVRNNFILECANSQTSGTGGFSTTFGVFGIRLGVGTGYKVYHNTVSFSSAIPGSTSQILTACLGIVGTGVTGCDIRNNIFSNRHTGGNLTTTNNAYVCIYLPTGGTSSMNLTMNNNALYQGTTVVSGIGQGGATAGTNFYTAANFSSTTTTPSTNLRSYTSTLSAAGTNDNATLVFTSAPPFTSTTNLHIPAGTATMLESGGASIGVTTDIDNQTRPGPAGSTYGGGVLPDIGADEFDGIITDLIAPTISYTSLGVTCATGDRTLTGVTISDVSGVPTSGSLMPRIWFRKNSGTWFSNAGSLTSGTATSGTWSFTITAATMGGLTATDVISYYVIAQDVASTPNISANPGTGIVATNVNTITTHPTTPSTYTIGGSLSGTYTVGASGAYPTITAAINAYNVSCLSGAVTFVLTDASYSASETFPIVINSSSFASSTVTLTIKPATGVSPVISGNSTTSIFKLNGADYVTIDGSNAGTSSKNLTITNTNTGNSANAVVWIASASASDGATNNTIKNCIISGDASTTTEMCIFSGGTSGTGAFNAGYNALTANSNNTIQNNTFMKSQYAVWLKGTSLTALDQGNQVLSNAFGTATSAEGFNAGGLVMQFQNNATVSKNEIQNVVGTGGVLNAGGSSTVFTGLYIRQSTNTLVSSNKVYKINLTGTAANRVHALYVESPDFGTSGNPSNNTIVNNAIYDARVSSSGPSTWTVSGLSANGGYGDKFYYNTVNLTGVISVTSGPAAAFSNGNALTTTQTSNITVQDNIFVMNGSSTGGSATFFASYWYSNTAVTSSVLNYNDLSVTMSSGGTGYVGYNGTNRSTFADWQTATTQEANSKNISPAFVSATDPHLQLVYGNVPLMSGTPIAGITVDIDNTTRSSSTPVMGCHEANLNAIPPTITYTPLSFTCLTGNRTLTATIGDVTSGVPTSGTTVPRIYYRQNSGTWYSQPGTLTSGTGTSGTWTFTILASDMPTLAGGDVVSYYVIAQTNAGSTGSVPSTGLVATNVNSVTTHPTAPNTYNVSAPMTGTYTVGSGGTFSTLTAAANAYNTSCLSGAVVFSLISPSYPSETFPITFSANPDASATNTLTIRPAVGNAATIAGGSSSIAVVKLLDARYITIDGVNTGGSSLTLTNANTGSNTAAIWLASTSGNTNITLKNMTINGGSNSSTTNWGIVAGINGASPASTNGMDNDYVTIQGNTIKKCGYAVMAVGTAATAAGGLNNWVVKNNTFGPSAYSATDNLGYNGVFMRNMVSPLVSGNTIQFVGLTSSTNQTAGIYMEANVDGAILDSNTLNTIQSNGSVSGTGSNCAFYMGGSVINTMVSRNKISAIYNNSTGGWGARAIILNTGTATSNTTIVNNFISDVFTYSDAGSGYWPMGISISGTTGGVNVYNNTINLYGTHSGLTSATGSADLFIESSGGSFDVRNNVFVNSYDNTSSTGDIAYAIYTTGSNTAFSNIDYNDYYVSGTPGMLGYIGSARATLADIITGFGGNTHSINVSPTFVSPTDLHLQNVAANLPLAAGTPISGITVDIDGTTRSSTTPVMGCHELNTSAIPPAIAYTPLGFTCTVGNRTVTATIADPISGVPTSGSLVPRIYYRQNTGAWFSQPGTLTAGTGASGTWSFTILASDMPTLASSDVVSYYIIAQTNAGIVGSNPAAGLVATNVNTVTTPPTTPNTYLIAVPLSGTYTVGSGGTYSTLTAAANAYNTSCLSGPVVFSLISPTYPSETYPITLQANPDASATNTLTIRPAAGNAATITSGSSSTAVVKFLNAKYITIDGVKTGGASLSLINGNSSSNTAAVWLASTASVGPGNNNISLLNMNLTGGSNSSTTNNGIVAGVDGGSPASTNGADNDYVTIQGNTIKKCGYAVMAVGTAATAAGGLNNWVVKNNTFGPSAYSATDNLGYNGVFMRNMVSPLVSGNTIQFVGLTSSTNQTAGIYMEANVDGAILDSNTLNTIQSNGSVSGTGSNCAFYMGGSVINTMVSRNKISAIYNNSTGGWGARAIILNTGTATSNTTIVNNFISDVFTYSDAGSGYWPMGISISGTTGGVNVYNNTINLYGTHSGLTSATGSADLFIESSGGSFDVRNNVFVNSYDNTSSTGDIAYAIYTTGSNTAFSNIDYNDYYVSGTPGVLGYIGSARTTLAAIVSGFGGNTHSLNTAPAFVSSMDLHLQPVGTNFPLISGLPIAGVVVDIDGVTRSTATPVIGAHEVQLPPCSSAPTPGTVTASVLSECGTFSSNLTLSGTSTVGGLGYQWQSSPDNSSWGPITGATSMTYSATLSASTYYRVVVTCTLTSANAPTPSVQLISKLVPSTITGTLATCVGGSVTLSSTPTGGTWTIAPTSVATIGASSGVVTGASIGSATVTYATSNGCSTTTGLSVISAPSAPVVSPATSTICEGGSVALSGVSTYSSVATINSGTISMFVPSADVSGNSSAISVALPAGATITGASVTFNANMTYISDLTVNLTAPNGNTFNLFNQSGGSGDNFVNTVVSSTGSATFGSASAPFTGTYAAEAGTGDLGITGYAVNVTNWSDLYSTPNGSWRLSARDFFGGDDATFTSWSLTLNYTVPSNITWSPLATLYTAADLSTAYTGGITPSVYAKPTAPGTVATVTTYTATATVPGCAVTNQGTATVTVNPLPSAIVGSTAVCQGLTTSLTNADAGGTWSSSNTTVATIGTSGVVTGGTPGTATISYTFTGTGCVRTAPMTVNAPPDPITGIASVCQAATITLGGTPTGGTWASDATGIASIDASTGVVTGGAAGLAMISYILPTTCMQTKQVTVNPLPVLNITPSATPTICEGESASFTASSPLIEFPVLSQDFNGTLGSWTITNVFGDAANVWQITSSPFSGTGGDGTPMLESAPSAGATSAVRTILTSPGFSTVGFGSAILTFNQDLESYSSVDNTVAVEYSIDNGATWTVLLNQLDSVVHPGTWTASAPQVSIGLPAVALNIPNVKLRWNYDSYGVSWGIDNIFVKGALPAATFTWAGVGTADGLSCTTCATPTITPTVPGVNVYSVTANSTCSTTGSVTVNVNPSSTITGNTALLCTGKSITLSSSIPGGTWAGSNAAIATVDAGSGIVSGITPGSIVVTYTTPTTGCLKMATVNVSQAPQGIAGSLSVCQGFTTTLSNTVSGGAWSSSNTTVATIDAVTGVLSGLTIGSAQISYVMPSGCFVRSTSNVRPVPSITGSTALLCTGSTITLAGTIAGGTWVSSDTAVATVDFTTGVVSGLTQGSVVISYALPTSCGNAVTLSVNQTPGSIAGALHICEGLTTALGNTVLGGSWSSSDPTVATINSTSGLTTAVAPGTSTISYTMPSGCQVTDVATVDPVPTAFTGSLAVCLNSTTTLGTTPTGGTWVSDAPAIADVDMTTGVITGMAIGTANITYTSSTGCVRTEVATVNALPVDITGTPAVCQGLTTTLVNTTGGGTWSSSDVTVATIDGGGVVSGLIPGTTIVSYTLTTTGCYKTKIVTVNGLPDAIPGPVAVCEGLTITLSNTPVGGTWISDNLTVATIDATTGVMNGVAFGTTIITYQLPTGCISTAVATVNPVPVTTTGTLQVCVGLTTNLVNTTGGGTWSSDNVLVAGIDATGMVTGNTIGTANILYTLPTGCLNSVIVTVNPLPNPISSPITVCEGLTTTVTNTTPDGTWSSSAPLTAGIDALTGVMTGVAAGNATITYTLATGCIRVADATVNALPSAISGIMSVCQGSTTTLFNTTPGGTWSNDLSGNATVASTGIVSGVASGTASISYTLGTGCLSAAEVTVNVLPTAYSVTGGGGYCAGTSGAVVGLGNSELNVNYDLYQGSTFMGSAIGTGSAISFGSQSVVGTYTVFATSAITSCANDMAGSVTVSITPLNIPAVTLNTAATTVCSGIAITYTAIPVNGGTLPVYNWEINGSPVSGATAATYSYMPLSGDIVKVTLNSNAICAIPSTATDLLTMTVNTSEMPVASISTPTTNVCAGSGATFSVVPGFGGTTPSYEWFVNGTTTGVTSTVYTYAPSNGDVVTCKMGSNFTCRMMDTVVSNSLTITTTAIALPIVSLSVSPSAVIIAGTPVTFTATVSGVGSATPSYKWLVNGIVQAGATGSTFTSDSLKNNDSVTCKVNVAVTCGFENFNSIVVKVKQVGVSQVFGAGNIMLVPNPNQGDFTVKGTVASESDEEVFVEVVDMLGQIVYKGHTATKNGALNERIKLSNTLANGMYMLNLRTATETAVFHFVLEQ